MATYSRTRLCPLPGCSRYISRGLLKFDHETMYHVKKGQADKRHEYESMGANGRRKRTRKYQENDGESDLEILPKRKKRRLYQANDEDSDLEILCNE